MWPSGVTLKRESNRETADRVESFIRSKVVLLADAPGIGHWRRDLTSANVRFFPVYSYLIVYQPETKPLQVVSILHGKRDVEQILARLDLWSDDPAERLTAAREKAAVGDLPASIGKTAPMKPWPYGMPSSINPFVVFLGPGPGNAAPVDDPDCRPYDLPTAAEAHPGLYVRDRRGYWDRVRTLGSIIVHAHAPTISDEEAHALIGQLNLSTKQSGKAGDVKFEPEYCRWVPEVILDYLRPSYVILLGLLGLRDRLETDFDPLDKPKMRGRWNKPDRCFPFTAYTATQYKFRIWNLKRPDGKTIRFVMWPQHPGRAPMTSDDWWQKSGHEFMTRMRRSSIV